VRSCDCCDRTALWAKRLVYIPLFSHLLLSHHYLNISSKTIRLHCHVCVQEMCERRRMFAPARKVRPTKEYPAMSGPLVRIITRILRPSVPYVLHQNQYVLTSCLFTASSRNGSIFGNSTTYASLKTSSRLSFDTKSS
jgi:hypothetical protein